MENKLTVLTGPAQSCRGAQTQNLRGPPEGIKQSQLMEVFLYNNPRFTRLHKTHSGGHSEHVVDLCLRAGPSGDQRLDFPEFPVGSIIRNIHEVRTTTCKLRAELTIQDGRSQLHSMGLMLHGQSLHSLIQTQRSMNLMIIDVLSLPPAPQPLDLLLSIITTLMQLTQLFTSVRIQKKKLLELKHQRHVQFKLSDIKVG